MNLLKTRVIFLLSIAIILTMTEIFPIHAIFFEVQRGLSKGTKITARPIRRGTHHPTMKNNETRKHLSHKLVSLNIWGGHIRRPLIDFVKSNQSIDIFCLQEVYHKAQQKISTDDKEVSLNIFSELQECLPEHEGYFLPVVAGCYGIGTFIRKEINVLSHGAVNIHENPDYIGKGPTHGRRLQWLECQSSGKKFYVSNLHGLWNGEGKSDSIPRIIQSKKIRAFMDSLKHPHILCGDFNLKPNTQSMKIVDSGMNNLVTLNNILSTRTSHYRKAEKFADYIITSPEIKVNQFTVMADEVSDHSPLHLEFELRN